MLGSCTFTWCDEHVKKGAGGGDAGMGVLQGHIRTFVGVLRAIATAMEKMVEGTDAAADPVVHSFGKLAEAFHLKHKEFNSAIQKQRG